ncbi:CBN-CLS-2 protein [Caenorhabditis brenneri]|uniref:CBN-CLS-2 protein n=1 Tax=Caenorhabditis brenneri TaxID=135651 RepID=G0MKJ0_CAEBE|nr:CBN-CLS-2 protein [Caenorhabditis brenneri]
MSRVVSRTAAGGTCVVNKEDFIKSFTDVPKITVSSLADAKSKLDQAISLLSKSQEDWTKRMNQLKAIRSIVLHGEEVIGREQLIGQLIRLTDCLDLSIKDLRSQILKEAAVTCSFLFERYGNEVHQIAERCLPSAFSQLAVSTKIMATSGATLAMFIVQYVHTKQIFTCITSYATSKDKNQRRQVCNLLEVVIEDWNDKIKKPLLPQICELIKAAISDADPETRTAGRKVFSKLDATHPEEAEKLFASVDASKQKMLRATDAASSSTSINSERGTAPFRSKLSVGSIGGIRNAPNISSKFLAQRSASAIDTKQVTRMTTSVTRTPNTRPMATRTLSKVDTSPGGSKFTRPSFNTLGPRTSSNLRARGSVPTSQPGSRNGSPPRRPSTTGTLPAEMQRVKSNLGAKSFVSSLTSEQAESLQKAMSTAQDCLGQPSRTEDDEFLLPKRPKPKTPQKSAVDISRVEAVIRACSSTSQNEKREGIRMLSSIVSEPTLNPMEIKNIGAVLNRLLGEATNPIVLQSVESFVTTHHDRLTEWLKLGLGKMFAKKGSEMMQNMKKQISTTMNCILSSFDPNLQFRVTCELMCDPIYLLTPKARVALLEYLNDLVEKHMERGTTFNTKEVKATLLKMFSWMTDPRNGSMILPHGEKLLCSLFALNAADFSALFSDFNPDYRDSAYRILQSHGHHQHAPPSEVVSNGDDINVRTNISSTAAQIEDFVTSRNKELAAEKSPITKGVNSPSYKRVDVEPLRPLSSEMNSQRRDEEINLNESFDRLKLNSTTHLIDDVAEQSKFVSAKLAQISEHSGTQQNEGLLSIQTMLCEGSFTLWEQNFAKLLIAVFDVLSKDGADANKKIALRVLTKMCTSQASRLFDSTEIAVCKVLDAAVNCVDGTMNVAADDCLKTLATHLPLAKIVSISKVILNQENVQEAKAGLVLKMMTRLFEGLQADELSPVIDELAPCAIRAYDSPSSAVRKTAVYCLVAMVNKLGMKTMEPHLQHLSSGKLNLVQVYVNRAMSSSSHSHV